MPKQPRKREFLDEMNRVVLRAELTAIIELYYSTAKTGRPPFGIAVMLRIHFVKH